MEAQKLRMKIDRNLIIVAFLLYIGLISCAKENGTDPIRIGVVTPLTGDFGSYGQDIRKGIDLAIEQINGQDDVGQKRAKVFYEDGCMPEESVKAVAKLVEVDDVEMITGVLCIVSIVPMAKVTENKNITIMSVAANADMVLNAGSHIFSTNIAIKHEAGAQADFAIEKLLAKRAAVVFIDTPFGIDYDKHFTARFEQSGARVTNHEKLDFYGSDFRTQLSKVKPENPDVILAVHLGNQMGILIRQAREMGLEVPIIGTYEAEDPSVVKSAGDAIEGFIISSPTTKSKTQKQQEFTRSFLEEFGSEPTLLASNAYDAVILQISAHSKCKGDRECIRAELSSIKDHDGASGIFSIGTDGTAEKPIIFKRVVDGQFVPYDMK